MNPYCSLLFVCLVLSLIAAGPAGTDPVRPGETGGTTDGGATEIKALFPKAAVIDPTMEGEDYAEYDRGGLYDYINGGAEVYLDLGFVKVGAKDYVIELEEETYFTLDVYDMGDPVNAFGIYSAEKYGDTPSVKEGVEGYIGGGALHFWSRRYYVKIRADDEGEKVDRILKKMANQVGSAIGDPGKAPPEMDLFPRNDRVPASERFAAKNMLGIRFLKGFSCRYEQKKAACTLHLCRFASDKESAKAEKQFCDRLKMKPLPNKDGEGLQFEDRYLGRGRIFRIGAFLCIVQSEVGAEKSLQWENRLFEAFFKKVAERALKKKTDDALKSLMGGKTEKK